MQPVHTTAPGRNSTRGSGPAGRTVVRWVYPSRRGRLSLLRGHTHAFGRDTDADTVLEGSEASRKHARMSRGGDIWVLRDLESSNGTFVNGRRITEAQLQLADVVRMGEWVGVLVEMNPEEVSLPLLDELAPGLLGGPTLRAAVAPLRRAARADLPIIVQGATGTGKEVVARALHHWSERSGPFAAVNCAALPEAMAEGELFGYRRGAFTGAERAHPGHFRSAEGGTLLLDEILELPTPLQAKLLRVLEQQEVQPLGEPRPIPIDVRIVAAAQGPLGDACEDGRFRSDLYARLDGFTVELPALADRREDIVPLFRRFVQEGLGGQDIRLEPKLVESLCLYSWPQNIRELALMSKRLLTLHGHEPELREKHLPERVVSSLQAAQQRDLSDGDVAAELISELKANGGNLAQAARKVNVTRQRAYRLLQAAGEDLESLRGAGS